jgi:hypothetical protein
VLGRRALKAPQLNFSQAFRALSWVYLLSVRTALASDSQLEDFHHSRPDTASATFDRGLFVANGHVVEPPLTLRLAGDSLFLNQFQLIPQEPEPPPPPPPRSPRSMAIEELVHRVYECCQDMFMAGRTTSEVMDTAESLLEASPLVAKAEPRGDNDIRIQFRPSGTRHELLNLNLPVSPPRFGPWPRSTYHSRSDFDAHSVVLSRGGVVMHHRGASYSMPADRAPAVRECIAGLLARGVPYEDGTDCAQLLSSFQELILEVERGSDH